jgi:phosphopantetheine--protein transferase-like protein
MARPLRRRYTGRVKHFQVEIKDALPHGVLAGVSLPGTGAAVPDEVLSRLHADEVATAASLRAFRQESFVGGRLAAQAALRFLGLRPGPVHQGPRGEPVAPEGLTLSISHKRHLAVALVARADHGTIGVDLEDLAPAREGIGQRILTPAELTLVEALPPERQWTATVLRFALKEAIYKALAPHLQRYIDFSEAELRLRTDGTASVSLNLREGPAPAAIDARYTWLDDAVLGTARARWS